MKPWFDKFKKDYNNKNVLILGLGLLGKGINNARFFVKVGANVTVTDLKNEKELAPSLKQLKGLKIKYVLGKHRKEDILKTDMVFRSPAVPLNSLFLKLAHKNNIPVWMDEALFFKYAPIKAVGITGTRGKSTTTVLIYKILKAAGLAVHIGGNISGVATLPLLEKIRKDDWLVAELSSWQLQGFEKIRKSPDIAVLTNIYEDHLNRYNSMADYINDKKIIFKYQKTKDHLITNKDLIITRELADKTKSKVLYFSKNDIKASLKSSIKLKGDHNLENVAAALKVIKLFNVKPDIFNKVVSTFKGIDYRLEKIATIKKVNYINDTTSTTPIAGIKALDTFQKGIILIAGGASKNLNMKLFAEKIVNQVKGVVLLKGTATAELKSLIIKNGGKDLILGEFDNLKKAVLVAKDKAKAGDVVLLSPGCASFGLFSNEFDRGDQFNKIVKGLNR